jgi:hypothetical protein
MAWRSRSRPPRLIAANRVTIDLDGVSILRDANRTESVTMILSASQNQVVVRLPSGSPKGAYEVSVNDPFGNSVLSVVGQSEDGVTLHVVLNLKDVKPGKHLVCVTRESEVPDCVPATVIAR